MNTFYAAKPVQATRADAASKLASRRNGVRIVALALSLIVSIGLMQSLVSGMAEMSGGTTLAQHLQSQGSASAQLADAARAKGRRGA